MDETIGRILWPQQNVPVWDLTPEFCQYRDEGCELADSCLNCPFPACLREERRGKTKMVKKERAREMDRLYTGKEKSTGEVAAMFGVSARTLYRELKTVRDSKLSGTRRRQLKKFVAGMKTGKNKGGKRK